MFSSEQVVANTVDAPRRATPTGRSFPYMAIVVVRMSGVDERRKSIARGFEAVDKT